MVNTIQFGRRKIRYTSWVTGLIALGACNEGVKWAAKFRTANAAWKACRDIDWVVWLLTGTDSPRSKVHKALEARYDQISSAAFCRAVRKVFPTCPRLPKLSRKDFDVYAADISDEGYIS